MRTLPILLKSPPRTAVSIARNLSLEIPSTSAELFGQSAIAV
jgi:hypothetical protein